MTATDLQTRPVEVVARVRRGPIGYVRLAWKCRWNALRLVVAAFLLWMFAVDTGARLARLQLMKLQDMDYVAEIRLLRDAGRYGEAIVVADAGLENTTGQTQIQILQERQATIEKQKGFTRRIKDVGLGALTGSAGMTGDASLERIGGALAADLFVVGDIRDLVIQGARYVTDGETDPTIVALSTLGIATTLAPEIDWVPALLKIAKKAKSLTKGMEEFFVAAVKSRRYKEAEAVMADVGKIAEHSSPAGALRILRYAEKPEDAARLARFVEKYQKGSRGAFALHVTGKEGAGILKRGEALGAVEARAAERIVMDAARKGPAGASWLKSPRAAVLLKPHPIIGLAKGVWKGNVQHAVQRILEETQGYAGWLIPLLAGWVVIETGLLARKVTGGRRVRVSIP